MTCFTPDRGSLSSWNHCYNDDDLRRRGRGKTSVAIERLAADAVALNKRCILILYKCVSMPTQKQIQLRSLAAVFLRAGNLTFGGGDAITALLQRELVHRREWLTRYQYGLAQSLAKVTPGTAILAFCAATAWMMRRSAGSLAAVLAVSVPSAVIAVFLTMAFTSMSGSARALAVLGAVLAASIGLMWAAAWLLVKPELNKVTALRTVVLVFGVFIARWWSVSPIEILAGAAIIGALWSCEKDP